MDLRHGDCLEVLKTLPNNSVDAVVTDPPYELGFMGKGWDSTGIANNPALWAEAIRVLKPGGHVAAFSSTRTYHRMACAIEDAGFEVRDQLAWTYGQGFPKSLDVSKAIDKLDAVDIRRGRNLKFTEWMRSTGITSSTIDDATGSYMGGHYLTSASQPAVATRALFELLRPNINVDVPAWVEALIDEREVESENFKSREITAVRTDGVGNTEASLHKQEGFAASRETVFAETAPATAAARQWNGWGTALKPAWEPICLARKPLSEKTVAANVLRWGTGAINVGACKIEGGERPAREHTGRSGKIYGSGLEGSRAVGNTTEGRFPANLCHDGSDEVLDLFPETKSGKPGDSIRNSKGFSGIGDSGLDKAIPLTGFGDEGSAARFFYCAKASKGDRSGSKHPTVKPVKLMQWLCRLITPPGGIVLDPFAGSGTTGTAALLEGFRPILIEREDEYVADIRRRIGAVAAA